MTVHFYDAGQALAALVTLPDGRHVLIDAGESPTRPACKPCKEWHQRVMAGLKEDLGAAPIDMLWITHQHSDHLGGALDVLSSHRVMHLVDNGEESPNAEPGKESAVEKIHKAAKERNTKYTVVAANHTSIPLQTGDGVRLSAIVPPSWPHSCSDYPNDCSIGLRIDYCKSSVLFEGDAEEAEEAKLSGAPVTLLQVGHHGSNTSSTEPFVKSVHPAYAVVSSAKKGEGTNSTYCHPIQSTVDRFTTTTGGPGTKTVLAFDAQVKCNKSTDANWHQVRTSDRMWFTARDGDVVLATSGDGAFQKPPGPGGNCCKTCKNSQPCGDTCIASTATCTKPKGCACAGQ
jgi:competence protein ComEC